MPKVTRLKVNSVLLVFLANRKTWRASYTDANGKYHRHFLHTTNRAQAIAQAKELDEKRQNSCSCPHCGSGTGRHSVDGAIAETIMHSSANEATKVNYAKDGLHFKTWLQNSYPAITLWKDLLPKHLEEYRSCCEARGLAYDTIRLRLYVLRAAARYMVANYPEHYRLITAGLKLRRGRKREIGYLTQEQLQGYLGFASEHCPDIYPIMTLQSLAGLRMREVMYLRSQDIDWTQGTVEITDTPDHKPKNLSSYRTIPVTGSVLEAIREAQKRQRVVPVSGYLFTSRRGEAWRTKKLSAKIAQSLKRYAIQSRDPRIATLRPRELRATFVTLVRSFGVDERLVKRYIGHAAGDVLGDHYEAMPLARLAEVVRAVEEKMRLKTGRILQHFAMPIESSPVSQSVSEAN